MFAKSHLWPGVVHPLGLCPKPQARRAARPPHRVVEGPGAILAVERASIVAVCCRTKQERCRRNRCGVGAGRRGCQLTDDAQARPRRALRHACEWRPSWIILLDVGEPAERMADWSNDGQTEGNAWEIWGNAANMLAQPSRFSPACRLCTILWFKASNGRYNRASMNCFHQFIAHRLPTTMPTVPRRQNGTTHAASKPCPALKCAAGQASPSLPPR